MAIVPIPMPKVDQAMEEGTLVEWTVQVGDVLAREDVVAVIETDKVEVEVETFVGGTVARLVVEPGAVVPVGATICEVESDEEV
jgi:pyruvate dehydrogenase E2 component (dihydrolipoamide acetyltransferase)